MSTSAERTVIVLLGDVENSRHVADREALAAGLERACGRLNDEFAGELMAPVSIIKGIDEVGAALTSFRRIYDMLAVVGAELRPERMRFVVAAGEVDTAFGTREFARMDGPVFHRAAGMMGELKSSRLLFAMSVGDPLLDEAVAGAVNMLLLARAALTERQWEVVRAYELHGSQVAAASVLGVSQQAVSHVLVGTEFRQLRQVEASVRAVMEEYSGREESGTHDVAR
jgi:hypothetical protein